MIGERESYGEGSTAMSIGIWKNPRMIESDWGVIEYTRPRPELGEVGYLTLVSTTGYEDLLIKGPVPECGSMAIATATVTLDDDDQVRRFYHLDYNGKCWTWELFSAHWTDKPDAHPVYIGRWPD